MDNHKVFKFTPESTGIKVPSILYKVIVTIQNLLSPDYVSNKELIPVKSIPVRESSMNLRHAALINMLNHGKNYDDANLILDEAEDWELDYDLLNPSKVAVHGRSVWIDAQD
jgi:hypothetical protein